MGSAWRLAAVQPEVRDRFDHPRTASGRFLPFVRVRDFSISVTLYAQLNSRVRPEAVLRIRRDRPTADVQITGLELLPAVTDIRQMMSRRSRKIIWSRTGLCLVGIYFILTVLALITAFSTGDTKGNFVLLQLPIALQIGAMPESLLRQLAGLSWGVAYLIIWPATALILYLLGYCAGYLVKPQSH